MPTILPVYLLKRNPRTGYWEIRWSERHGSRNRTHTRSTGETNRAVAEEIFQNFREQVKADKDREDSGLCQTFLDDYEAYALQTDKSINQVHITRLLKPFFGPYSPMDITPEVTAKYARTRVRSSSTMRRHLGVLKAALNYAVKQTRKLKAADLPYIMLPPGGQPRDVWMNETEEGQFWDAALAFSAGKTKLARITLFVAIGLRTGARKRAIETLTWDRVDLQHGTIDFRDRALKTSKKRRAALPIADDLTPILKRAYLERGPEPYVLGLGGDIRWCWETFVGQPHMAQFAHITPHVMRHTFATLAMRRGVPIAAVAGFLGDTIATVERVYAHHSPDHLRVMFAGQSKAGVKIAA